MAFLEVINFKKAFDSLWRQGLWSSLATMGMGERMITTVKNLYEMAVKTRKEMSEWIKATIGSRQGNQMSPQLLRAILEKIMENMEVQEQ
jgi:Reverse transcriptase (RNA-dependent DNA polymerase)